MNRVYCFSGSGRSRKIADFFADKLGFPLSNISFSMNEDEYSAETAVLVFPVYRQAIPEPVCDFLSKLRSENIAIIATYGKKSFGNVIYKAASMTDSNVIAGACIPMGHCFLNEDDRFDFSLLSPVIERIMNPSSVSVPKSRKSFYADFISPQIIQFGVKIKRSEKCLHCGKCEENCPMNAIHDMKIGKNCIRCLRCVTECPEEALSFSVLAPMKIYLSCGRKDKLEIYL